jgi:hypothetical protein
MIVTLPGSPPKLAMLSRTHFEREHEILHADGAGTRIGPDPSRHQDA